MAVTYTVFKGAEKVAENLSVKTYDFTGLTAETEYTLGVAKVDNGVSSVTATIKVTTAAAAGGEARAMSMPLEEVEITSITASQKTMSISDGENRPLTFEVNEGADPSKVVIESSDESVATYVNGEVIPHAAGKATIKASANGIEAEVIVTVK